jgi:cytosine/adenosine deaminase-related metal-dependent hydrolase
MRSTYSISGVTILTPERLLKDTSITIKDGHFSRIGGQTGCDLHLDGSLVLYPALINIHDHLRGTYLPRVGPPAGEYYLKCSLWERDLKASAVLKERSKLSVDDCYYLGAYKNLLSGAVTVNDHFPHELNNSIISRLPLRVIKKYTLHHEVSASSLEWGKGIAREHEKAVKKNYPFIVHAEEGFDEDYQGGIEVLEQEGALDQYSVLIHGLGFSDRDIAKVRDAGCTVVWCPASNYFMFNVTCKIRKILQAGINVALGTDSTHTGSINILEEMRYAKKVYKRMYREELPSETLFKMVSINAARALRRDANLGSIEKGKLADLLLLKVRRDDPYDALCHARIEDIELLTQEGVPLYGARKYKGFFHLDKRKYTDIVIKGQEKFARGNPSKLLEEIRKKVGFKKMLDFLPLEI